MKRNVDHQRRRASTGGASPSSREAVPSPDEQTLERVREILLGPEREQYQRRIAELDDTIAGQLKTLSALSERVDRATRELEGRLEELEIGFDRLQFEKVDRNRLARLLARLVNDLDKDDGRPEHREF